MPFNPLIQELLFKLLRGEFITSEEHIFIENHISHLFIPMFPPLPTPPQMILPVPTSTSLPSSPSVAVAPWNNDNNNNQNPIRNIKDEKMADINVDTIVKHFACKKNDVEIYMFFQFFLQAICNIRLSSNWDQKNTFTLSEFIAVLFHHPEYIHQNKAEICMKLKQFIGVNKAVIRKIIIILIQELNQDENIGFTHALNVFTQNIGISKKQQIFKQKEHIFFKKNTLMPIQQENNSTNNSKIRTFNTQDWDKAIKQALNQFLFYLQQLAIDLHPMIKKNDSIYDSNILSIENIIVLLKKKNALFIMNAYLTSLISVKTTKNE